MVRSCTRVLFGWRIYTELASAVRLPAICNHAARQTCITAFFIQLNATIEPSESALVYILIQQCHVTLTRHDLEGQAQVARCIKVHLLDAQAADLHEPLSHVLCAVKDYGV
jgi:hypothetical protein